MLLITACLIAFVVFSVVSDKAQGKGSHVAQLLSIAVGIFIMTIDDAPLAKGSASWQNLMAVLAGFFLLSYAADKLVDGASVVAEKLGVSALVVGLTVVAFGTSMPEMVISVQASLQGNAGISVGNAVGSNIMNAALILGIAALIQPISCHWNIIRREVPVMIGSAALVWFMAWDHSFSRVEGGVLFTFFLIYNYASYRWAKQESVGLAGDEKSLSALLPSHHPEVQSAEEPAAETGPAVTPENADPGSAGLTTGPEAAPKKTDPSAAAPPPAEGPASAPAGESKATDGAAPANSQAAPADADAKTSAAPTAATEACEPGTSNVLAENESATPATASSGEGYLRDGLKIGFGLVGLAVGAKVLLFGAVTLAKKWGVSDEVIALTLIAVGTSLPELATSVVSAWRGRSEITLGNVVGSNIFNLLGIVGVAAMILPLNVSEHMFNLDIPLMVVVSLGVLPIMSSGLRIVRAEGALLVAAYLGYLYILLSTNYHT